MKTYEKPVLMVLSLSANDKLCGYCAENGADKLLYNDPSLVEWFERLFGNFNTLFGQNETECVSNPVVGYCKFTTSGTDTLVAWS